jgi:hypothetical protein
MKKVSYKRLPELFVQTAVRKHLLKSGFGQDLTNTELHEHGVDIKVKHNDYGRYYLVEAKGDPSPTVKSPEGWRSSAMNSALGQIITRMHTNRKKGLYKYGYKYGIAFPYSFKNRVLSKIPYDTCNKLNLNIFLVNPKGQVEEYNHKQLKTIQSHA